MDYTNRWKRDSHESMVKVARSTPFLEKSSRMGKLYSTHRFLISKYDEDVAKGNCQRKDKQNHKDDE